MKRTDPGKVQEEKISMLEKELSDLRQGLCLVQDYYHDLEKVAKQQDAEENVDASLLRPLLKEDEEFEGIWKFHDEMLIPDPIASVSHAWMYESFLTYCTRKGRSASDRESFEFVLLKMGLRQDADTGAWLRCRLRTDKR
jgi:hypothetical protein